MNMLEIPETCPICGEYVVKKYNKKINSYFYGCSNINCSFRIYENSSSLEWTLQGTKLNGRCLGCGSHLIAALGPSGLYARCCNCIYDYDKQHKWGNAKIESNKKEIKSLIESYSKKVLAEDTSYDLFENDEYNDTMEEDDDSFINELIEDLERPNKIYNLDTVKSVLAVQEDIKYFLRKEINKGFTSYEIYEYLRKIGCTENINYLQSHLMNMRTEGIVKVVGLKPKYQLKESPLEELVISEDSPEYITIYNYLHSKSNDNKIYEPIFRKIVDIKNLSYKYIWRKGVQVCYLDKDLEGCEGNYDWIIKLYKKEQTFREIYNNLLEVEKSEDPCKALEEFMKIQIDWEGKRNEIVTSESSQEFNINSWINKYKNRFTIYDLANALIKEGYLNNMDEAEIKAIDLIIPLLKDNKIYIYDDKSYYLGKLVKNIKLDITFTTKKEDGINIDLDNKTISVECFMNGYKIPDPYLFLPNLPWGGNKSKLFMKLSENNEYIEYSYTKNDLEKALQKYITLIEEIVNKHTRFLRSINLSDVGLLKVYSYLTNVLIKHFESSKSPKNGIYTKSVFGHEVVESMLAGTVSRTVLRQLLNVESGEYIKTLNILKENLHEKGYTLINASEISEEYKNTTFKGFQIKKNNSVNTNPKENKVEDVENTPKPKQKEYIKEQESLNNSELTRVNKVINILREDLNKARTKRELSEKMGYSCTSGSTERFIYNLINDKVIKLVKLDYDNTAYYQLLESPLQELKVINNEEGKYSTLTNYINNKKDRRISKEKLKKYFNKYDIGALYPVKSDKYFPARVQAMYKIEDLDKTYDNILNLSGETQHLTEITKDQSESVILPKVQSKEEKTSFINKIKSFFSKKKEKPTEDVNKEEFQEIIPF